MKKTCIILFFFTLLFSLPFFLNVSTTFPRLDSDYDAVLPVYQYIGSYTRQHHAFPIKIPFIGGGIPVFGDPISGILNPIFLLPLMLFDINTSIRITFFLVIFTSGITMFLFLRKLKVPVSLRYWGAFLYMSSGIITACIAAGHITEKFLSIPLLPLFLLVEIETKITIKKVIFTGAIIAATVYSGDLYGTWFFYIFTFCIEGFYFFKYSKDRKKRIINFIASVFIFLSLSSPLLYLFITKVLPIMKRPTEVNPFFGSVHAFLLPLQFLVPFQVNFYDRPFFQRHMGFYYNWYEYYGFLGLFPALFLINLKKNWKDTRVQVFILLIIVGSLYLASRYFYSPFHWIYLFWKGTNVFRVPQRIVIPLTPVVIALFCILAQKWKNRISLFIITFAALVWTVGIGWFTFSYTFVPLSHDKQAFVEKYLEINSKKEDTINFLPFTQYYLAEKNIPIYNYYYAWVPKNILQVSESDGKVIKGNVLNAHVKYILATDKISFSDIGYKQVMQYKGFIVWEKIL